jgi:primosomal protein N' (replication factor Y)
LVANSTQLFARVVIDSNLPQLDREFEYQVPEHLQATIELGSLVKVPFGKSKTPHLGYVVGLGPTQEFNGVLANIENVESSHGILSPSTYRLCTMLAARQACSVADVLKLAVPMRAATVDKIIVTQQEPSTAEGVEGWRRSVLADPCWGAANSANEFILKLAAEANSAGGTLLLLVPDQRSQSTFEQALQAGGLNPIVYVPSTARVERFRQYSRFSREAPLVIIASRSGAYLPIKNLHTVVLWDDGDGSYNEPTAPYLSTREVILARQQLEGFNLAIVGNAVSTEAQRLCEVGHFQAIDLIANAPKLATSEDVSRIDSLAWRAIRDALAAKQPVLVQVAARGSSVSAYCKACRDRIQCQHCHGPIWLDERQQPTCRWCNAISLTASCQSCGGREFLTGRAGSTRTATELGRAFPGAKLVEATGTNVIWQVKGGPQIVVATPGAEPTVPGGYGAVVLLDAANLLARDTLRAREEAIRNWANALALLAPSGRATLTGLVGETAQALSLWQLRQLASRELAERRQLGFPPAIRMASVVSSPELLHALSAQLAGMVGIEVLGPLPIRADKQRMAVEARLLIKYGYGQTLELAAKLKDFQLEAAGGAKAFSAKSGRAIRPVRVRMEEVEVI